MGRSRISLPLLDRRRKRAARRRLETGKFIPSGDSDFALMARRFAQRIELAPERYGASAEDVVIITRAVQAYRDALSKTMVKQSCNSTLVFEKDKARKEAEKLIRSYGGYIRAHPEILPSDKKLVGVRERPQKLKKRTLPKAPPRLEFKGSTPDGAHHILKFVDDLEANRRAKPPGAARLELFFDLVPPGDAVPAHPIERWGWPRYLRSYTSNPIEVEFPQSVSMGPMLVVYWARWSDAKGEVGRFSKTCVARVEGGGWVANRGVQILPPQGSNALAAAAHVSHALPVSSAAAPHAAPALTALHAPPEAQRMQLQSVETKLIMMHSQFALPAGAGEAEANSR